MKRLYSLVAMFSLLMSVFPVRGVQAAGADDLVKCPDFSAVYYVGDDGNRYVFPNENIYFSWYPDFSEVKTVSCDDLASFPIGDRLVYQPGTSLVKIPSDPSVYAVESDGVLREIPDEDTAEALFGDDWAERVDDVSEAFWPSFTVGEPLEEGEIPEGTVLEDEDGNLYRVDSDGEATEIDVVLDTDDEKVLKSNAVPLDDFERRLGIAMALVRVDSDAAIAVLEQLLAELKPVHVEDEDVKDIDEIDEMDDDNNEGDADDAMSDAKEEIAEAESDIAEDEADGKDTSASEVLLESAREHLAMAESSYAAGDFDAAEVHADEARHDAMWARGKAVDSIDDDEDEDESEDEDTEDTEDSNDDSSDASAEDDSGHDESADEAENDDDGDDSTSGDDAEDDNGGDDEAIH